MIKVHGFVAIVKWPLGHHACPKSTCTQSELCDMLCNLVTITILCFSKCLTESIDLYENFIKFPWCVKNSKTSTFTKRLVDGGKG